MQTRTLIQSSTNILRITELHKGNVIKLIDETYNSNEAYFGVVTDLLNSGKKTFIQLLLFKRDYNNVTGQVKIYNGNDDISLFPATIEEVKDDMASALKGLSDTIEKEKKELERKIEAYKSAESFVTGETSKKLTEASFEEVTTEEFKEEEKIKQIEAIKEE